MPGTVARPPAASAPRQEELRLHARVRGPFDGSRVGVLEIPVRIYDLSEGGCFVTSQYEQQEGVNVELSIELPGEGRIAAKARTVRDRPGFGFGVRFIEMSAEDRGRLARALARHLAK